MSSHDHAASVTSRNSRLHSITRLFSMKYGEIHDSDHDEDGSLSQYTYGTRRSRASRSRPSITRFESGSLSANESWGKVSKGGSHSEFESDEESHSRSPASRSRSRMSRESSYGTATSGASSCVSDGSPEPGTTWNGILKKSAQQRLIVQTLCVVMFCVGLCGALIIAVLFAEGVLGEGNGDMHTSGGNGTGGSAVDIDPGGDSEGGGIVLPIPSDELDAICSSSSVQLQAGHKECLEVCKPAKCCFARIDLMNIVDDGPDPKQKMANSTPNCYEDNEVVCRLYAICETILFDLDGSGINTNHKLPQGKNGTSLIGPGGGKNNNTKSSDSDGENDSENESGSESGNGIGFPNATTPAGIVTKPTSTSSINELMDDSESIVVNETLLQGAIAATQDFNAIKVKLRYSGMGWIGFGISPSTSENRMVGSEAVIGLPPFDNDLDSGKVMDGGVFKYNLSSPSKDGVIKMVNESGTLINATVVQNKDHDETILTFTKLLNETGELVIDPARANTFIWAVGMDGVGHTLARHDDRDHIELDLSYCYNTESPSSSRYCLVGDYVERIELRKKKLMLYYKLLTVPM